MFLITDCGFFPSTILSTLTEKVALTAAMLERVCLRWVYTFLHSIKCITSEFLMSSLPDIGLRNA